MIPTKDEILRLRQAQCVERTFQACAEGLHSFCLGAHYHPQGSHVCDCACHRASDPFDPDQS